MDLLELLTESQAILKIASPWSVRLVHAFSCRRRSVSRGVLDGQQDGL